MDLRVLEFWGQALLAAARGQRQAEELKRFMQQGFPGGDELSAFFRRVYGGNADDVNSASRPAEWDRMAAVFQKGFQEWCAAFGLVPLAEVEALRERCRDLESEVQGQAETIRRLERLVGERALEQGDLVRGFQELMRRQSEAFQVLMAGFGAPSPPDDPP
jgi:hypothetical protein